MRLTYSSNNISETTLIDDSGRQVYSTTSSPLLGKTEVTKFGQMWNPTVATLHFHNVQADTITINGQEHQAKEYLNKPSWLSRRRVFTTTSGNTYEWVPNGTVWKLCLSDGREVGRSHSRSLRLIEKKHGPYLEFDDDPVTLNDLDELVTTFVYVQMRREKDRRAGGSGVAAGVAVTV